MMGTSFCTNLTDYDLPLVLRSISSNTCYHKHTQGIIKNMKSVQFISIANPWFGKLDYPKNCYWITCPPVTFIYFYIIQSNRKQFTYIKVVLKYVTVVWQMVLVILITHSCSLITCSTFESSSHLYVYIDRHHNR